MTMQEFVFIYLLQMSSFSSLFRLQVLSDEFLSQVVNNVCLFLQLGWQFLQQPQGPIFSR